MADIMKLGLVLSATDKLSMVVDKAFGKATKSMTTFQQKSDKLGKGFQKFGAGMVAAGGAITGALFADVQSVADKAKNIQFSSQKIGLTTEEYQKLGYAASKSGMEISQLEVGMGKLSKTMVMAATGQKASNKIFEMAGVSVKDSNGKLKSSTQILTELSDKFKKAPNGAKKTALAMMLFGKSGKDMIPLLNKGGKAIDELGEKLKKSGALLGKDSIESFKKYRAEVANSKLVLEGLKTQIAIAVLPQAIKFAEKIAVLSQKMGTWIQKNKTLFTTIITTVAAVGVILSTLGTFVLVTGTVIRTVAYATKIFQAMKFAMFAVKYAIFTMNIAQKASAVWTGIVTAAQWAWNAAMTANPIGLIVAGIALLIGGLVLAWNKFEGFRAVIKTTWEVVKGFGTILKEYVVDRIKGIISGLGSMGKAISLLFKGKFSEAGKEALKGVKDLSGISAGEKAFKKTVNLTKTITPTFNKIYKEEHKKQLEKDGKKEVQTSKIAAVQTAQAVTNQKKIENKNSNVQTVSYAPVVHITGASPTAKADFMKLLKENQIQFFQFLNSQNKNQQRISYQPV